MKIFRFILKTAFFLAMLSILYSCTGRNVSSSNPDMAGAFAAARIPLLRETVSSRDFSLPLLLPEDETREEIVTLSELRGKIVFLNFWATWCPPCRMEMPSMESLHQELKDRDLIMLAVNVGEAPDLVSGFMEDYRLTFPVAMDRNGSVSRQYGVQALPTTYIIDRRGLIVSRLIGAIEWDTPEIIRALEGLLGNL
jgi:thiol-disulfide isomerase/thioredoxin